MPYWDHKAREVLPMQYLSCFVAPWASIHSSTHWGGNSKHFFVSLHWGEAPNRTDMYCNGKYNRYGLFANTISAGVAPFLMGLLSVCSNFLKIIRKKCAENLVVCDIRINTHTHIALARQGTNYLLIVNALARKLFPVLAGFFLRQHLNYNIPPPCLLARVESYPAAICEVQSVPVCRRPALCPTLKNQ